MATKVCATCKETKSTSEFTHNGGGRFRSSCKFCTAKNSTGAVRLLRKQEIDTLYKIGKAKCTSCNSIKNLEDFFKSNRNSNGVNCHCKSCTNKNKKVYILNEGAIERRRMQDMMRIYNISETDYKKTREVLNCQICEKPFNSSRHRCIDHCHNSNEIRGILCSKCNTGIGMLGDNLESILKAVNYLKSNQWQLIQN